MNRLRKCYSHIVGGSFLAGKAAWALSRCLTIKSADYCMLINEWAWIWSQVCLLWLEVDLGSVLESELGQKWRYGELINSLGLIAPKVARNISSLQDNSDNSRTFAVPRAYFLFSSSTLLPQDCSYSPNFTTIFFPMSGNFRLIDLMRYKYNQELSPPKSTEEIINTAPACVGIASCISEFTVP